jgi:hypothetical protein
MWDGFPKTSSAYMDDRGRLYFTSHPLKTWELQQEPASENVYQAFWVADELRWLAVDRDGKMLEWSYTSPSLLFDLPVSPLEIWSIAANPDGATVAISGCTGFSFAVMLILRFIGSVS